MSRPVEAARRFLILEPALQNEVERWFVGKPAEPILRRVREIILAADPRMTEYLKYGTVQFAYEGDFANFVQHGQKTVSLMFNPGRPNPGHIPPFRGQRAFGTLHAIRGSSRGADPREGAIEDHRRLVRPGCVQQRA